MNGVGAVAYFESDAPYFSYQSDAPLPTVFRDLLFDNRSAV